MLRKGYYLVFSDKSLLKMLRSGTAMDFEHLRDAIEQARALAQGQDVTAVVLEISALVFPDGFVDGPKRASR